jgi:hypothetical protein
MGFEAVLFRSVVLGLTVLLVGMSSGSLAAERIWAEAVVSKDRLYVHETAVYRVRVFSQGNLRSIQVAPPEAAGVSLEELEGPVTSTQTIRGRRHIVSEFRYAFTPMTEGVIRVEPAELTITQAADSHSRPAYGSPWQGRAAPKPGPVKVSTQGVNVHALPPVRGVQPWLPLEFLDVEVLWSSSDGLAVGEPLTLTVTLKALGAKGTQLPSLESYIQTPDFKVYPERPQTDWKFGPEGGALWGRRVETFTLVPTREGQLTFPPISLPWWNVRDRHAAVAKIPGRVIAVGEGAAGGGGSPAGQPSLFSRMMQEHTFLYYVLPVGGGLLLAFAMGIWLGSGSPGAGALSRVVSGAGQGLRDLVQAAGAAVGAMGKAVLPARVWEAMAVRARRGRRAGEGLLGRLVAAMPARAKTWWCVRCVSSEKDAAGLCQALRRFACEQLNMDANAPLRSISHRIAEERPKADPGPLHSLLRELDDAAYGGRRIELATWKQAFKRRFRSIFATPSQEAEERRDMGLPKLNP